MKINEHPLIFLDMLGNNGPLLLCHYVFFVYI